jgi:glycosyltransferase involved in cell wall biosynthesis
MLSSKKSLRKKIVVLILNFFLKKSKKYVDGYMIVSNKMKEYFIENKFFSPTAKFLLIEGITDSLKTQKFRYSHSKIKRIVYTGGLSESYGVKELVEAFLLTSDSSFRLILCGDGDLKDFILQSSKIDKRINYLGVLNHSKVIKLQQLATVLINPRKPESGLYTKYSFPIKTMEYLSTGRPFIAYKLEGIPQDYHRFIIFPNNNSVLELRNCIENCFKFDRNILKTIFYNNSNFVAYNKNPIFQARQILDFYESI